MSPVYMQQLTLFLKSLFGIAVCYLKNKNKNKNDLVHL